MSLFILTPFTHTHLKRETINKIQKYFKYFLLKNYFNFTKMKFISHSVHDDDADIDDDGNDGDDDDDDITTGREG